MRRLSLILVPAIALLALAGCGRREAPPAAPAPRPAPVIVTPATSADYVATAASIDLFVVRASEIAQARSTDRRTQELAAMLIAGHRGLAAQLSYAGRRLNLLPRTTLLSVHEEMIRELETSSDIAGTYRRQMRQIHETALRLHSAYAARGDSPTLRPVAANAETVIRGHSGRL